MDEMLKQHLNKIATHLTEGVLWHRRVANELRKLPNKRGFARWHESESLSDNELRTKFDKMFRDNIKYAPVIDTAFANKAETFMVSDLEMFKQHFVIWMAREKAFVDSINAAIVLARAEDMEIYNCLCDLAAEVKNEMLRAEWVNASLIDTNWSAHDIRVVSKWLHAYFEFDYKGGTIDFNIG